MPRAKGLVDTELPGLDELDKDPVPGQARRRGRPPKAASAAAPRPPARPSGGTPSKAAMKAKVREEIGLYLELSRAGWSMRDEVCASYADDERLAAMADALTAMISRSTALLEMVSKSGIIGEIVKLLHAAWPIASAVWRHHGPGGLGHGQDEEDRRDQYSTRYPAYAGTR